MNEQGYTVVAVVKAHESTETNSLTEPQIAAVLVNQFGNGCLYVPRNRTRQILHKAGEMGLVDDNGLLTRKGRALMARYT